MVTIPSEAAEDIELLTGPFSAGMDVARIDLSHIYPKMWGRMSENIGKGSDGLNPRTSNFMHFPGSKFRIVGIYRSLGHRKGFREVDSIPLNKVYQFEIIKESELDKIKSNDRAENHIT